MQLSKVFTDEYWGGESINLLREWVWLDEYPVSKVTPSTNILLCKHNIVEILLKESNFKEIFRSLT